MKKIFAFLVLVTTAIIIFACGSSKDAVIEDPGLLALMGDKDYASLTSADKYEVAQYLVRRGNLNRARMIYEDIIAHTPSAIGVKYKLALIYLDMDTVYLTSTDQKKNITTTMRMGTELAGELFDEIKQQDPDFLPVYSTMLIHAMQQEDTAQIRGIYASAKLKDPTYSLADYRIGYLSVFDLSNENRYREGIESIKKAQTTFKDLYEAYKQLGNIQKVQGMDTLAYASYQKALKYRTESYDLFDLYYELADVCYELYRKRNVEQFKNESLEFACTSLRYFEGYKPSVELIRSLIGKGSDAVPDSTAVKEADEYCKGVFNKE
jgi:tetratricopeptide (TPR) repeat protein